MNTNTTPYLEKLDVTFLIMLQLYFLERVFVYFSLDKSLKFQSFRDELLPLCSAAPGLTESAAQEEDEEDGEDHGDQTEGDCRGIIPSGGI